MKKIIFTQLFLFFTGILQAGDLIKVVTTTTDLAWAAKEIGGKWVEVTSLLNGTENPHYVDAIPEYVRLVSNADVVCIVGLDLEVGWMPKIFTRSGNAKIQQGGKGYCDTGKSVTSIEKPSGAVDRTMGDIHPYGNPHYWLSPKAMAEGAKEIKEALQRIDTVHTNDYQKNFDSLVKRLDNLFSENKKKLESAMKTLNTKALVIEYHKEFSYFFNAYGIKSFGSIEEKPGIPPSAGRIAEIAIASKSAGVKLAMAGDTVSEKTMNRFTELSGVPHVEIPTSLQRTGNYSDYFQWQRHIVEEVLKAFK